MENLKKEKRPVSVFDFTNYRLFLKNMFDQAKELNPNFSYRLFNRKAGIASSAFLKLVIDGKRNLAKEGIRKITKGFNLNDKESHFFENLVYFNQATHHEEKNSYFKELAQNTQFKKAKQLEIFQYNLFSHWYYVAILELVKIQDPVKKDALWIAKKLNPAVGLVEVKKAVIELKKLKVLGEDKQGNLFRLDPMLATPDEVASVAVGAFHIQMSELAKRAVEEEKPEDREFSALTIATSEAALKRAKKEIQEFRKKIHAILEEDSTHPKKVVSHLNLQLFNLTK